MTKKSFIISLLTIVLAAPAIFAADPIAAKPPEKSDYTLTKLKFESVEEVCIDFIDPKGKYRSPHSATDVARFNLVNLKAYTNLSFTGGWTHNHDGSFKNFYFQMEKTLIFH